MSDLFSQLDALDAPSTSFSLRVPELRLTSFREFLESSEADRDSKPAAEKAKPAAEKAKPSVPKEAPLLGEASAVAKQLIAVRRRIATLSPEIEERVRELGRLMKEEEKLDAKLEELKKNAKAEPARPQSAPAPLKIARPTTSTLVVNVSVEDWCRPILPVLFAEVKKRVSVISIDFRVDASSPADVLLFVIGRSGDRMNWGLKEDIFRRIRELQNTPARSNAVFLLTLQETRWEKGWFDPIPPDQFLPQYAALGCSDFFTTTVDVANRRLGESQGAQKGLLRLAKGLEAHMKKLAS